MLKSSILIGSCGALSGIIGLFGEGKKGLSVLCIIAGLANIVTALIIDKKEKERAKQK